MPCALKKQIEASTWILALQPIKTYLHYFSAMFAHRSASLQLFPVVWIFQRSFGVICFDRWVLSEGHKNYFKNWCVMNSQPTFLFLTNLNLWIMAILSKSCKPDNFELHNPLNLSFTNIWGLHLNFVDCKYFYESNSSDLFAVWDKPGWLNWFWQFLCEGLSSFNLKGF